MLKCAVCYGGDFISPTPPSSLPPIIYVVQSIVLSYLWEGTGEPCAGQTKLKDFPVADLKTPSDSELEENLGDDVPTGSMRQQFIISLKAGAGNQRAVK